MLRRKMYTPDEQTPLHRFLEAKRKYQEAMHETERDRRFRKRLTEDILDHAHEEALEEPSEDA